MTAAKPLKLLLSGLEAPNGVTEIGPLGAWRRKRSARKEQLVQSACGEQLRKVGRRGPE